MLSSTALATLIFAAMAGIGTVVRCYQNQRYWRLGAKKPSKVRQRLRLLVFIRGVKAWHPRGSVKAVFASRYRDADYCVTTKSEGALYARKQTSESS
jgi:hypothetical protein